MLNVCHGCGLYRADKQIAGPTPPGIDSTRAYAICPECGYRHPFLRLPLLVVAGASGAGKSAVCHALLGKLIEYPAVPGTEAVLLDADILWRAEFDRPAEHYRDFFETWLRVAKNIGQSGRPVTLFGAGFGVPENVEPCVERRYFSQVHYLTLVCAADVLAERLRARPGWRGGGAAWIDSQIEFNRWFREHAAQTSPPIQLLDTTGVHVAQTAAQVAAWILANLHGNQEITSCAQTD